MITHDVRSCMDFLDDFRELDIHRDYWEAVERALLKLKYVERAWIDHTCLIETHLETDRFDVAGRRVEEIKKKARRVLERYARYSLTKV